MQVVSFLINNERLTTFAQLEQFMQEAFPQIATVAVVTPEFAEVGSAVGELHVEYVGPESHRTPLQYCGSGIEQMLALAVGVLTADDSRLFLIDEPQAFLHPHAERSLLALLADNPLHQYLIATHSAYLLGSRPLRQARLLTLEHGQTEVAEVTSAEHVLAELGVTAADLWLAESILWVEGPSEAEVIATLARLQWPDAPGNFTVRAMPDSSRFSSRSARQADATFRFCEAVAEAVAPLEVHMRFLFDADEKSQELRDRITAASGGRATFLPARELENLFLDSESIHATLSALCERVELSAPALEDIRRELDEALAATADPYLFPEGLPAGAEPASHIIGSHVLDQLWWRHAHASYDKVADGRALAAAVYERAPEMVAPIIEIVRALVEPPNS